MSENLNEPQSRTEEILQNALGEEYDVTPQSRVEKLLEQVVDGGGSGSGAVEVIKLGTSMGGGSDIGTSSRTYTYSGNFVSEGGKTFAELIGDKTVLRTVGEIEGTDGKKYPAITCTLDVKTTQGYANEIYRQLELVEKDSYGMNQSQANTFAIIHATDGTPSGKPLTIYAICI